MTILLAYLKTWRLKLRHTKTVTAAFYLSNREVKHELKFYNIIKLLLLCPTPTYFWEKLDTLLTFHHYLALCKKLSLRVKLMRKLVGSGWGSGTKTLHTVALSLVFSTAEYCASVLLQNLFLNFSSCLVTLHFATYFSLNL